MRIDKIEAYHVALPLKPEAKLVLHDRPVERLETVLVRLVSGRTSGWGEAAPGARPFGGPEWAGGVFRTVVDCLGPAVVEKRSIDTGQVLAETLAPFRGNRFAKAALDAAWWDLKARLENKPLPDLLGAGGTSVEVGVGFDRMESPDALLREIKTARDAGYARIELKIRPGWDLGVLGVVRQEFGGVKLHVDVEGGLTMGHTDILYRFDDFLLEMIEQPLAAEDLVGHAMLAEAIRTPVCLDESITTPLTAELALDLKSAKWFNLEPGKLGGITAALDVFDKAKQEAVDCWVGAAPQSAIGTRASLALAAKVGGYPTDYFPAAELLEADLAESLVPRLETVDDRESMRIALWSEPGIGVEPDPKTLLDSCVKQAELQLT